MYKFEYVHDQTHRLAFTGFNQKQVKLATRSSNGSYVITTLSGTGAGGCLDGPGSESSFNFVTGISSSPDGTQLAVADRNFNSIRIVNVATGATSTLAGIGGNDCSTCGNDDSIGNNARFHAPQDVSWSAYGLLIAVADVYTHTIRMITVATGEVITLAGNGKGYHVGIEYVDSTGRDARFYLPVEVSFLPMPVNF